MIAIAVYLGFSSLLALKSSISLRSRVWEAREISTKCCLLVSQLSTLPSQISYSSVQVESPQGKKLLLPRRELFDIRMQLAAEDEGDNQEAPGFDNSDIRTNVYEGGFKSWECSIDLARLLLDRGPRKDLDDLCRVDHVIEVRSFFHWWLFETNLCAWSLS